MTNRHSQPNSPDHGRHDELLVARYAASDPYPGEQEKARALVDTCAQCASLVTDIQLLSRATASLPAPRRTRDFRLSPQKAEELRGSAFQRLMRRLAAPGVAAALRPVAGVALSLGIVLAVAGSWLPQAASPAAAPASQPDSQPENYALQATPAAEFAPAAGEGAEAQEPTTERAAAVDDADEGDRLPQDTARSVEVSANPLFYAGVLIALVSLGVLLLSWFARWRAHDPLLR